MWDTYVFASSVEDALDRLASLGPGARVIAGGTDLVLQAQRGACLSRAMVDMNMKYPPPEVDMDEIRRMYHEAENAG